VLEASDKLATWLKRRPPELDGQAAVKTLLDILQSERIGHAGDELGHVRVVSASSIRSLTIPYLFLAGLSEKAFPPPDREDRLYSEAEYGRLIEAGLPFVARSERTREEMLLFYEAVTRATKRLYLSYPALDESAQPLLPSPFLREVEDAFGEGCIPRVECVDLRPVPSDEEPITPAEFRVKAIDMALHGNVAMFAGWLRQQRTAGDHALPIIPLVAGLELIHDRQDRESFGPSEGMLRSPESHCYLAARYSSRHTFAATDLERYASCPFRFFLERILKIEPLDDLALEFDVLERGRIVHDVMATFHQRVNERLGRVGSPLELENAEFDAMLAAAIAESLPTESKNSVHAAMQEVDRRLVTQWIKQYREQFAAYDALWAGFDRPMAAELFEVSFGHDDASPPSTSASLDFIRGNQTVRIAGRVDRIDTGEVAGECVFNILDYKTGGPIKFTPESMLAGLTLQLPLYSLAVMELLLADRDAIPWQAGYWYIRDQGFQTKKALHMYRNDDGRIELEPTWEDVRDRLGDVVISLVQGMQQGEFPVHGADDDCTGRCPFHTVCRVNQVRSLEKTWDPPTLS
jgi:ATP-dependent helicase/DNAse subunit B